MTSQQRALMPAVFQRYLVRAEGNPALAAANGSPGRTSRRAAEPIPRDPTRLRTSPRRAVRRRCAQVASNRLGAVG